MNVEIKEKTIPNGNKTVVNFYATSKLLNPEDRNHVYTMFLSYWSDNLNFCFGIESDTDADFLLSVPHTPKNIHQIMNFMRDCDNAAIKFDEIKKLMREECERLI